VEISAQFPAKRSLENCPEAIGGNTLAQ